MLKIKKISNLKNFPYSPYFVRFTESINVKKKLFARDCMSFLSLPSLIGLKTCMYSPCTSGRHTDALLYGNLIHFCNTSTAILLILQEKHIQVINRNVTRIKCMILSFKIEWYYIFTLIMKKLKYWKRIYIISYIIDSNTCQVFY